jgi:hypothetical protein
MVLLVATLLAGAAAAQGAQSRDPASSATGTPQVTVEAHRQAIKDTVSTFVRELTHSSRFSDESVARWRDALCFMVAGLPQGQGSYVLARLTQVAAAAGAKVSAHGCARAQVNFYVVFSPDPGRTLRYLNFHPALLFHSDAGRAQMKRFLNPVDPGAVRVWHNAAITGPDGQRLAVDYASCASLPGFLVNCEANGGSRLSLQAIQQFTEALVVVDLKRLGGASLTQVADYIAMVGLADFALDDDFGDAPTILRLFAQTPQTRPKELTEWDRAFLSALYHTDQRSITQREHIADSVLHDLADSSVPEGGP